MTAGQWEQVKELFGQTMEMEAEQRARFIRRHPDAEVRREVNRLLHEQAAASPSFLAPLQSPEELLERAADLLEIPAETTYEGQLLGGRYAVERLLAKGGAGLVYLARDTHLHDRAVVIKSLHSAWEPQSRVHLKFRNEIEALSRIQHPAVVGALDLGVAPDGRSFLVMEFVEGETLRARLQQGSIPWEETRIILDQIAEALTAAHERGVYHRDLKPENVMVNQAEGKLTVKLIDFGIARVEHSQTNTTATLTFMGTTDYVAPEQLMGQASVATDVYAMGVLSYEMATGKRPFQPETPFQLYELQRNGKAPPISSFRPDFPQAAEQAIRRALSFRPEDRPESARAFMEELTRGMKTRNPFRLTRRTLVGGAVTAAASAAAAAIWAFNRDSDGKDLVRVIESRGVTDPSHDAWTRHRELEDIAEMDSAGLKYDHSRLRAAGLGYFHRPLTRAQKQAALRYGWTMTVEMKPILGMTSTAVDCSPLGPRYDLSLTLNEARRVTVLLATQILPEFRWLMWTLLDPVEYPRCELRYDPSTRTASLWVDGLQRLTGYRGHTQFQTDFGVLFGVGSYRSQRAEALFRSIRFEIHT